jgi:hypothetical protein
MEWLALTRGEPACGELAEPSNQLSRRAYFSLFPQRTVAEFLCGGISDTEKCRNIIFFRLLQN